MRRLEKKEVKHIFKESIDIFFIEISSIVSKISLHKKFNNSFILY